MVTLRIDTSAIVEWASFHKVFQELMGFPAFYGCNMNAWIDCMSDISTPENPEGGMTRVVLGHDEVLCIEIPNTDEFQKRVPDIFQELISCTAFVNQRYIDEEDARRIALVFV